ncbi:hypothetical protein ruthe_02668 [Rubellimicrobium thermophilum DSM 16684]|uniref:Uncharacterized protein n=1 Tax=Rubellimicrobium thermophilum DSM 16684 TaxID=1123069 RepID=S9QVY1_9RHOB|nr:hypothetical protein [Rubellimicrobium thermophilum]EPX83717.1 hypothetical protein ruthe_02668 [Rubellimicrobium thermophilum DSM 16684]
MIALRHSTMEGRPTMPSPRGEDPARAAGLADVAPFHAAFAFRIRIAHA